MLEVSPGPWREDCESRADRPHPARGCQQIGVRRCVRAVAVAVGLGIAAIPAAGAAASTPQTIWNFSNATREVVCQAAVQGVNSGTRQDVVECDDLATFGGSQDYPRSALLYVAKKASSSVQTTPETRRIHGSTQSPTGAFGIGDTSHVSP